MSIDGLFFLSVPRRLSERQSSRAWPAASPSYSSGGGSPVEIEQADALVLVLMLVAIALSMVAWRRRGSQGSLAFFVLCLLGGALLGQALTYIVDYGMR